MIYRNTNTLYKLNDIVGNVKDISIQQKEAQLTGKIDTDSIQRYGLDQIVLLDSKNRYINADWVEQNGDWSISVKKENIGNDNGFLDLQVLAGSKSMNYIFPLEISQKIQKKYRKFISSILPCDSQDIPTFSEQYKQLIIKAMNEPYIARSNFQSIPTGNNYQTIDLGDIEQKGGRTNRLRFLYQIDFQNKSVLDLGANTGENSRIVRRLGANLVDGIEYDPYFVEIGRAINAVSGMTRVSLFQGDCTKPQEFEGMHYDIVLALAVWVYLQDTIQNIAKITNVMAFETHTLDQGMEFYYEPVMKHFPYAISLGYSDKPSNPHKSRMFVLFGKKQEDIEELVQRNFLRVEPYFKNPFIEKHNHLSRTEILDLSKRYYEKHKENKIEFLDDNCQFGREIYFEAFLAGFHQYLLNNKSIDYDNLFLKFLQAGIQKGSVDQQLKAIAEKPDWLLRKVTNKFDDAFNITNNRPDLVAPIEMNVDNSGKFIFKTTKNEEIHCNNIDGHHRFFMCQLAGIDKFHFRTLEQNTGLDQFIKYKQVLKTKYTLEIKK